ncbi:hypothetical protein LIER_40887 [Lithospermum erythrorhizon]|uniref:Uncharacterized protein n=1 Tax=Lithospermum erythrorhizon TaxID=34254 RepID=A0AAV3R262_LITER
MSIQIQNNEGPVAPISNQKSQRSTVDHQSNKNSVPPRRRSFHGDDQSGGSGGLNQCNYAIAPPSTQNSTTTISGEPLCLIAKSCNIISNLAPGLT